MMNTSSRSNLLFLWWYLCFFIIYNLSELIYWLLKALKKCYPLKSTDLFAFTALIINPHWLEHTCYSLSYFPLETPSSPFCYLLPGFRGNFFSCLFIYIVSWKPDHPRLCKCLSLKRQAYIWNVRISCSESINTESPFPWTHFCFLLAFPVEMPCCQSYGSLFVIYS